MLSKQKPPYTFGKRCIALLLGLAFFISPMAPAFAQIRVSGPVKTTTSAKKKSTKTTSARNSAGSKKSDDEVEIVPDRLTATAVAMKTTAEIMDEQAARGVYKTAREVLRESGIKTKKVRPDRRNLPSAPGALDANRYPLTEGDEKTLLGTPAPEVAAQTLGPSFNAVTGPAETGAFPPDTEAEVGPNSIVVFLNGRLRTFNKGTSAVAPTADGVLNVDTDVFFASVTTPPPAGRTTFTTDPNVRYDRISNRWFLNIIDVTIVNATGALNNPNRVLLAVSDAASNGNITGATVWTFYQFTGDATLFTDYQSFGVDASAIYIGANMFSLAGAFQNTKAFVIPKAPLLTGSPATVWAFSNLLVAGAGPLSPRGVDNTDPTNTGPTALGYFIGVDNATFNTLMLRRVTNPGSVGPAPTMSGNISIPTVLATQFPLTVNHLGDTGGAAGNLDALDDRLFSAMVRNGRLWTAHHIGVSNLGSPGTNTRNASRWYEIQNINTATPTVFQAGTLFDNTAPNDANQRSYWIPTIAVSGQGHAVIGSSIAGTNERVNAFVTGRLAGDALGTMREGTGAPALNPGYTASSTAYNPPGDPGGPRRWGDYSATVVDPLDDMTMWTFQEYCNGTNTYGVRGVRLIAPGPAIPNPTSIATGLSNINIVVTGTAPAGQGFYDPGANLASPALPFNHITASVSGTNVIVNSVTYNSPTQITLNMTTIGATAGPRTLTITNPDGQQSTGTLTVLAPTAAPANLGGRITDANGRGIGGVRLVLTRPDGSVVQEVTSTPFGYYTFDMISTGQSYIITPSHKRYTFTPPNRVYNHVEEFMGLDFSVEK